MYNPTNNTPENDPIVSVPLRVDSTDFYDTMDQLIATLPDQIKCIVDLFKSKEEKVVALYSSIVLSGTCFPNIKVNYHKRTYYLSLMLVIEGPPASGKGALSEVRKMLRKINVKFRKEYALENSKYKAALTAYKQAEVSGKVLPVPEKPGLKMIELTGNVTSAKLIEHLVVNGPDLMGVIIETEIDSFAKSGKNSHGDLLDTILRLAYEHETISSSRKTNSEYLNIETPKLAVVMSGTAKQVYSLIPSNENGTFSRYLNLRIEGSLDWRDVKPNYSLVTIDESMESISKEFLKIFETWHAVKGEVRFTDEQWARINAFGKFNLLDSVYWGEHASSLAKRHTTMLVKMGGILTMLRNCNNTSIGSVFECNDNDFNIAYALIENSIKHSFELFQRLPGEKLKDHSIMDEFLKSLPADFCTAEAFKLASKLDIPPAPRTVESWLKKFVKSEKLTRIKIGHYKKT